MTLRKILLSLVLVAGLLAYLVVYEFPQAEREATKDKLLSVDKDAITGTMDVWKRDAAYRDDRPPEFKRQIEGAVADRLAELDAEAGA